MARRSTEPLESTPVRRTVPRSHPLVPVRTRHHAGTTRSGSKPSTVREKGQLQSVPCTHPLVPGRTRQLPGTGSGERPHSPARHQNHPPKKNPVRSFLSGRGGGEKDDKFGVANVQATTVVVRFTLVTRHRAFGFASVSPSFELNFSQAFRRRTLLTNFLFGEGSQLSTHFLKIGSTHRRRAIPTRRLRSRNARFARILRFLRGFCRGRTPHQRCGCDAHSRDDSPILREGQHRQRDRRPSRRAACAAEASDRRDHPRPHDWSRLGPPLLA